MRTTLTVSTCVVILLATPVSGQTCDLVPDGPGIAVASDWAVDDSPPWGFGGGSTPYEHWNALKVTGADISTVDQSGRMELIVGGNGDAVADDGQLSVLVVRFLVGHSWIDNGFPEHLPLTEQGMPVLGTGTSALYDFEVEDVNGDGWLDIIVGRRLGSCIELPNCTVDTDPECTDWVGELMQRDTVFINSGTGDPFGPDPFFPIELAVPIENPSTVVPLPANEACANQGQTFAVAVGDVDLDGEPELVTGGANYGLRYFENDFATLNKFTWVITYVDGPQGGMRDVQLADVDGDGDLDLFASRSNGSLDPADDNPNRVWFNQRKLQNPSGPGGIDNPAWDPMNPFIMSDQPDMIWPEVHTISLVKTGSCPTGDATGEFGTDGRTFEAALADLDGDRDKDVVIANYLGYNGAYLNNGDGYFGSLNTVTAQNPKNDGCPAFVFPTITNDWTGQSLCLFLAAQQLPTVDVGSCSYTDYEFTVPASNINACTGVAIKDLNGDRKPDVAFSNRNDWEDMCVAIAGLPYFDDDPLNPTDDCYDLVFYNQSTPGNLEFCDSVELINDANDGTGYGEFIDINGDGPPDWLDANFANRAQDGSNNLWWGNTLIWTGCPSSSMGTIADGDLGLRAIFGEAKAGMGFHVLAAPVSNVIDAPLVLAGSGVLDEFGTADIGLRFDVAIAGVTDVWVAAVVVDGDRTVVTSNPVELVLE